MGQGAKLPEKLQAEIQKLSGADLSDVRVHYNSPRATQLQAQAVTQGNEIHLAPGQDRQLPHEAWHVVQQRGGRVAANRRSHIGLGAAMDDGPGLEREADAIGARAANGSAPAQDAAAIERDLLAKRTQL